MRSCYRKLSFLLFECMHPAQTDSSEQMDVWLEKNS